MQYHYVVSYDSVDKKFSVDVDTTYWAFEDGFFFDTETQKWIDSDDERLPFYAEDYLLIEEQLALTLLHHDECVAPFCTHCEGN